MSYLINTKFKGILTEQKILEGTLNGPQLRDLLEDEKFKKLLTKTEAAAWKAFKDVCDNFLGNHRADNYKDLVRTMMKAYHKMGVNQSIKLHYLDSHLEHFPSDCGKLSDEHGERFHQQIAPFEKRYQGKWTVRMLGEYCWSLVREEPDRQYKRKDNRQRVHPDQPADHKG